MAKASTERKHRLIWSENVSRDRMRGICYATTTTNTFYGPNNIGHMQAIDVSARGELQCKSGIA